jgi:hypothetical protein
LFDTLAKPETKKAREKRASDVSRLPLIGQTMTPTGFQQVSGLREKTQSFDSGGNAGGNTTFELDDLLAIWGSLDDQSRQALVTFALTLRLD